MSYHFSAFISIMMRGGAEKARDKRAELMAKYLDNEVEIYEDEDR